MVFIWSSTKTRTAGYKGNIKKCCNYRQMSWKWHELCEKNVCLLMYFMVNFKLISLQITKNQNICSYRKWKNSTLHARIPFVDFECNCKRLPFSSLHIPYIFHWQSKAVALLLPTQIPSLNYFDNCWTLFSCWIWMKYLPLDVEQPTINLSLYMYNLF